MRERKITVAFSDDRGRVKKWLVRYRTGEGKRVTIGNAPRPSHVFIYEAKNFLKFHKCGQHYETI